MAKISDYLTVGEAAAFLGVSRDSLRRWDRSGKLKARRHPASNFRLYLKKDLEAFLNRIGVVTSARKARSPKGRRVKSTE